MSLKNLNSNEIAALDKIIKRVKGYGGTVDLLSLEMDLIATHLNGNPLDLEGLANADKIEFFHDLVGIKNNIDRKTGKLLDLFEPRYSLNKTK